MKTILLIEDNKEMRENISEILELANYRVLTAPNGRAGVEMALHHHPDLIICDIMMPALDGYGVLHLLTKNPDTATIPFIFLTAKTDKADLRKGMLAGADDYITKPFDDSELLNAIETRLRKADELKKHLQANDLAGFMDSVRTLHGKAMLTRDREIRTYRRREFIYAQGQHPHFLYCIKNGIVKLFRQNEEGKEFITHLLREDDYFGVPALLEETPYQDSAQAITDSEIILIPRQEFRQLVHGNPQIAHQFIHLLAQKLMAKEEDLLRLAYHSVRKRVADALLLLQQQFKKAEENNVAFHISRDDLARLVGTATESLIRTLSDFKSEKLIDIRDGKIVILQEVKLRKMIN